MSLSWEGVAPSHDVRLAHDHRLPVIVRAAVLVVFAGIFWFLVVDVFKWFSVVSFPVQRFRGFADNIGILYSVDFIFLGVTFRVVQDPGEKQDFHELQGDDNDDHDEDDGGGDGGGCDGSVVAGGGGGDDDGHCHDGVDGDDDGDAGDGGYDGHGHGDDNGGGGCDDKCDGDGWWWC